MSRRRLIGRLQLIGALVAGAALPLAFEPFGQFYVAPLSYAALIALWRGASPRGAFGRGFAYGCAGFLAGMYWIHISIHEFGEFPLWLAWFLMLGLVVVLALYVGAVGYVAARWLPTEGALGWLGVFPALWVVLEWCRGWVLTGFGWLSAGYSQSDSWLFGFAPVLGQHGVGWARDGGRARHARPRPRARPLRGPRAARAALGRRLRPRQSILVESERLVPEGRARAGRRAAGDQVGSRAARRDDGAVSASVRARATI